MTTPSRLPTLKFRQEALDHARQVQRREKTLLLDTAWSGAGFWGLCALALLAAALLAFVPVPTKEGPTESLGRVLLKSLGS